MIRPTRPVSQCRRAQRTTTSSPPTNLRSSNLRRSSCRSLNRILHFRSGGPVSLRFSIVDSSSSHPSIPISGLKGRRDLLSRNDFNWQRLETARIATLSQQLFSVALKWKMGPDKFPGEPRAPHRGVSGGRGGWLATSRPQTEPQYDIVCCSKGNLPTVKFVHDHEKAG